MKSQHLVGLISIFALVSSTNAYAVTFTPPTNNGTPNQATGGASRGMVKFVPSSDNGAPRQATGGASRGGLFTPTQGNSSPQQATGGASRGGLFTPTQGNSSPQQATGGASRGGLFTPTEGNSAPRQASGGASRGSLFTPTQGNSSPQQASGGASRGSLFTPTQGNSSPQQASGGASRVGFYELNPSIVGKTGPAAIIGLLPQNFYGTTVSERPTFLIYIPASSAEEAVFSLKDEEGNLKYQMTIPVTGQAGVIPVQLPEDAPALAVGQNYQWLLALKLSGELNPSTPYIDGWVQRVEPSAEIKTAMQQSDLLKQATALGQSGVWYDCVAKLAVLHTTQPDDTNLSKEWEELLSSVNLQEITAVPILLSAN